jgi:protein SCO1/2/putative membrane protein
MHGPARWTVLLAGLCCALVLPRVVRGEEIDAGWPDFSLTERNGRKVTRDDLRGHVCVAAFVFTRCKGPCPQVTRTMSDLQRQLLKVPGVLLVTFTVDPEHDQPTELTAYANAFEADPNRWLFLTGSEKVIYDLMEKGLRVPRPARPPGEAGKPRPDVEHSTRLVVVDANGRVQGYFEGIEDKRMPDSKVAFEANLRRLRDLVEHLSLFNFPAFNASLNAVSALLLVLGYTAIRARKERLHAACMLTALVVSVVFLASYLYYHIAIKQGEPTRFSEKALYAPPWAAYAYYGILGSHTLLAVVAAPMALVVAWLGLRGRLRAHVRLARWTWPIWLYVSVTGVVVYWMLYRLYAAP